MPQGSSEFSVQKLNILMGANASCKTSIGRMLLTILNFIAKKEYAPLAAYINEKGKDAKFEIQFVTDDDFYRISSVIKCRNEGKNYSSADVLIKVNRLRAEKVILMKKRLKS